MPPGTVLALRGSLRALASMLLTVLKMLTLVTQQQQTPFVNVALTIQVLKHVMMVVYVKTLRGNPAALVLTRLNALKTLTLAILLRVLQHVNAAQMGPHLKHASTKAIVKILLGSQVVRALHLPIV